MKTACFTHQYSLFHFAGKIEQEYKHAISEAKPTASTTVISPQRRQLQRQRSRPDASWRSSGQSRH